MDSFERAFNDTIVLEQGYSNDPRDHGGATNFGITQKTLNNALRRSVISGVTDVSQLTLSLARAIYRADYWDALSLDKINDHILAAEIFDTAVNMGARTATRIAQHALRYLGEAINDDGIMGSITIEKINKWAAIDPRALFVCFNGFQFILYTQIIKIDANQVFARGWTKRIQTYREVNNV
jgi:lysozyme family protein